LAECVETPLLTRIEQEVEKIDRGLVNIRNQLEEEVNRLDTLIDGPNLVVAKEAPAAEPSKPISRIRTLVNKLSELDAKEAEVLVLIKMFRTNNDKLGGKTSAK
jgi:hypothetical protein